MSVVERHGITITWWAAVLLIMLILALNGGLR